jgi:hypothetical protein
MAGEMFGTGSSASVVGLRIVIVGGDRACLRLVIETERLLLKQDKRWE